MRTNHCPKSNRRIEETEKKSKPVTYICINTYFPGLVQHFNKNNGGVKLHVVLWAQTSHLIEMMRHASVDKNAIKY